MFQHPNFYCFQQINKGNKVSGWLYLFEKTYLVSYWTSDTLYIISKVDLRTNITVRVFWYNFNTDQEAWWLPLGAFSGDVYTWKHSTAQLHVLDAQCISVFQSLSLAFFAFWCSASLQEGGRDPVSRVWRPCCYWWKQITAAVRMSVIFPSWDRYEYCPQCHFSHFQVFYFW